MATEITAGFLGSVQAILQGIGTGIIDLFETLIYNSVDGLSPVALWMLVFMGITFALGIFGMLFSKIA